MSSSPLSLSLLKSSPFLTLTLSLYLLAATTSFFRLFSPSSLSSSSSPSRGPVHSEFEGDALEENKKGMGLDALWPVVDAHSSGGNTWKDHNAAALHALFKCLASDDCGKKQAQVVILEAPEFRMALTGWTSGEGIWARSIMEVLESLGYTYIFARDMNHVGAFHLMLPDLIRAVVQFRTSRGDKVTFSTFWSIA
ncbi:hypothetical protein BDY24DRAFT_259003 [Mrakia frigida]|uniref:uncharacterized protein n=1 Tax=Mrakia frigida TaxID=29902 RepID=UPI003FCC15A7